MTPDDISLWKRFVESFKNDFFLGGRLYVDASPKTLDLHGLTVSRAYHETIDFIDRSSGTVTIITGKSGQIRKEFEEWMRLNKKVASCTVRKGDGAFTIKISADRRRGS